MRGRRVGVMRRARKKEFRKGGTFSLIKELSKEGGKFFGWGCFDKRGSEPHVK